MHRSGFVAGPYACTHARASGSSLPPTQPVPARYWPWCSRLERGRDCFTDLAQARTEIVRLFCSCRGPSCASLRPSTAVCSSAAGGRVLGRLPTRQILPWPSPGASSQALTACCHTGILRSSLLSWSTECPATSATVHRSTGPSGRSTAPGCRTVSSQDWSRRADARTGSPCTVEMKQR